MNQVRIPYSNLEMPVEAFVGQFLMYEGSPYIITDAYMEGIERARLDLMPIPPTSEMLTMDKVMQLATKTQNLA